MLEWYEAYADYNDAARAPGAGRRARAARGRRLRRRDRLHPAVAARDAARRDPRGDRHRHRSSTATATRSSRRSARPASEMPDRRRAPGRSSSTTCCRSSSSRRSQQPTFIIDYPVELSPFAKAHRSEPGLVERFEAFAGGMEIANAFTELNDPDDQRARFEAQVRFAAEGDEEAQPYDEVFVAGAGAGHAADGRPRAWASTAWSCCSRASARSARSCCSRRCATEVALLLAGCGGGAGPKPRARCARRPRRRPAPRLTNRAPCADAQGLPVRDAAGPAGPLRPRARHARPAGGDGRPGHGAADARVPHRRPRPARRALRAGCARGWGRCWAATGSCCSTSAAPARRRAGLPAPAARDGHVGPHGALARGRGRLRARGSATGAALLLHRGHRRRPRGPARRARRAEAGARRGRPTARSSPSATRSRTRRRVDRLVLDSVVPQAGVARWHRGSRTTACARGLPRASLPGDPAADLAAVVRRDGDGPELLDTLVALSVGAPQLPGGRPRAARGAARATAAPLRRLVADGAPRPGRARRFLSAGLHAATLCADMRAPWGGPTRPSPAAAPRAVARAAARVDPGPFDRATGDGQRVDPRCARSGRRRGRRGVSVDGTLPPVPALLLAGDRDLSTPLAWPRAQLARHAARAPARRHATPGTRCSRAPAIRACGAR